MQTNQVTPEAKKLARCIYDSFGPDGETRYPHNLMDHILRLSPDGKPEYHDCAGFLSEIAIVLLDEDNVINMDPYYRLNAAWLLRQMIKFFTAMHSDMDVRKYIMWYNLQYFSGNIDKDRLEDIQGYAEEEFNISFPSQNNKG